VTAREQYDRRKHRETLAAAPRRDVTPDQFHDAAFLAGWQMRTIELMLKPPRYGGRVLVGGEALHVLPCGE
jgi:hypothetical protein